MPRVLNTESNTFEHKNYGAVKVGDIILYIAANGHAMEAVVKSKSVDGFANTSQHDAVHSAKCDCYRAIDSESFATSSSIDGTD